MRCRWRRKLNLIGQAFCRLLAVGRLLHWIFVCWFWLFLRDFPFLDNQEHPKRSPQKFRDKRRALNRAVLTHPDQLATHILKTRSTTTGEDRVTRLSCNSGVSFRNRSDCWSQWPSRCSQLWSHIFLVWIRISCKFNHHQRSVSNGWVLSPKIRFLLNIRVSWARTRLSSHFYPAFRLLKRSKKWENNLKRV